MQHKCTLTDLEKQKLENMKNEWLKDKETKKETRIESKEDESQLKLL